jgi:hypothetical protein
MSETLDYRLGLVPEIRLPIGADFAVGFTFTGLTLTGYTGNFTARKSNRKSTNPYFWSSSTVTIGANSASVSFAADDEDANDKPFSTVATLNGTDYALTLYDDGAIVLRLQGKITWIDGTGAFEAVTPANASFAVAVGESVAIPVTVTMASEGGAFDLPAAIHAATAKNSIADNDEFAISDSAAEWALKKVTWTTIRTAVSGLITTAINAIGLGNSATRNVGTTAGTVAAGDDSRLSDARTPTAHKASHISGADALTPGDIGAATAAQGALAASAVQPGANFASGEITANGGLQAISGQIAIAPYGSSPFINVGVNAYYAFCSTSTNAFVGPDSALHPATGGILLMTPNKSSYQDFTAKTLVAVGAVRAPSYTVSAALALVGMQAGDIIYVTNEVGGACLATYNGSAWKRQSDLATISA